jgi:hypothetical protein
MVAFRIQLSLSAGKPRQGDAELSDQELEEGFSLDRSREVLEVVDLVTWAGALVTPLTPRCIQPSPQS